MRAIPPALDPQVVTEIDRRLAAVATEHDVHLPWAVESGGRAWDFPSPASDDDCRFDFVPQTDDHLSLCPARDPIAQKAPTHELGAGTPTAVLEQFVTARLQRAAPGDTTVPAHDPDRVRSLADAYVTGQLHTIDEAAR